MRWRRIRPSERPKQRKVVLRQKLPESRLPSHVCPYGAYLYLQFSSASRQMKGKDRKLCSKREPSKNFEGHASGFDSAGPPRAWTIPAVSRSAVSSGIGYRSILSISVADFFQDIPPGYMADHMFMRPVHSFRIIDSHFIPRRATGDSDASYLHVACTVIDVTSNGLLC